MKNQTTDGKSAELHLPNTLNTSSDECDADTRLAADSLWQRSKQVVCAWLERAERRVTEGFRMPPDGGWGQSGCLSVCRNLHLTLCLRRPLRAFLWSPISCEEKECSSLENQYFWWMKRIVWKLSFAGFFYYFIGINHGWCIYLFFVSWGWNYQ